MNFENQLKTNSSENENKEEGIKEKNIDNSQEADEKEIGESVSEECLRQMKSGMEVGSALKQIGKEALDKGLENRQKAWEESANVLAGMRQFSHLENASDDELKNEYIKNFESQSSNFYLGKMLAALDSEAFKSGFFNAYHDRPSESLSEELSKTAKVIERLAGVAKKIKAEVDDNEKQL
jgi:hypothetical protein